MFIRNRYFLAPEADNGSGGAPEGNDGADQTTDANESEASETASLSQGESESPRSDSSDHTASQAAELAELREKLAAMEAREQASKTLKDTVSEQAEDLKSIKADLARVRRANTLAELKSSGVPKDLLVDVAGSLGDIDVTTTKGKEAFQKYLEARPSLTARKTAAEEVTTVSKSQYDEWAADPLVNDEHFRERLSLIEGGRARG